MLWEMKNREMKNEKLESVSIEGMLECRTPTHNSQLTIHHSPS